MTKPDLSLSRRERSLNGLWTFQAAGDSEENPLRVPGCYGIPQEGKWRKNYWDAHGYPADWDGQGGRYQRRLELSADQLARPLLFRCGGCFQVYRVLLNGQEAGSCRDGYSPALFPLNDLAVQGSNLLEVEVLAEAGELQGGEAQLCRGIWQDCSLISCSELYIEGTPAIETRVGEGHFSCRVLIRNLSPKTRSCRLRARITDGAGKLVRELEGTPASLAPAESFELEVQSPWEDARLWFPHDPQLYKLSLLLLNEQGDVIDHWEERFGFREITCQGPHLYLNGQELYLRGHGGHYLGDLQGSKAYHLTWFRELKKRGVNFLRLHVYPKHRDLYHAADEAGIMLMGEPAFHFTVPEENEEARAFSKAHLGRMIDHLRNHPSIIMWSVSNELRWRGGGEKPWLVEHGKACDSTRPVFSSDFSAFSTHGDLIGHHYNTDTVFEEWEEHGPDKPMIWDECGEVWQPKRPLHNGSAGYEFSSQDYATGTYRDGATEILYAMDLIREGRHFAGELHRINAVVPWDLGYVFFRWQPYNRFRGIALKHADPEAPGLQPKQVLPCSSPLNIWDPTLPVYEPNPGFYLFEEDIKEVRFPGEAKLCSFFSAQKQRVESPLMIYEDLRPADSVACRVEHPDGQLLSECVQEIRIDPGEMKRNISWSVEMPGVERATPVRLVRSFQQEGQPGYRDVREACIYPPLTRADIPDELDLWIHDPGGALLPYLREAGIPHRSCDHIEDLEDPGALLISTAPTLPPAWETRIEAGLKVIHLLPEEADFEGGGSAVFLLNGPKHRVLEGIGQEQLTHWRGGNLHGRMPRPAGTCNHRMLLAGDRDGSHSALHECYRGSGLLIQSSLRIVDSLHSEATAHALLRNLIRYAAAYRPALRLRRNAVYGSKAWQDFVSRSGVVAEPLHSLEESSLKDLDLLLLEADAAPGHASLLSAFAERGGTVLVQELGESSLATFREACGLELQLTEAFLGERHHCVKAATCWTLRNSPRDGVEYFEDIVIPQPFEPNLDPLLAGIANLDLKGQGGHPMFSQGITAKGFDPVGWNDGVRMLLSNWRIDWSVPPAGGEYISVGKDIRRAQWFLNRDPLLLRVDHGRGLFLFNQLDLPQAGENGLRLFRQLLTNLGASLGCPTFLPEEEMMFDPGPLVEQRKRLLQVREQLSALEALPQLPDIFQEMKGSGTGRQPRVLLFLDEQMRSLSPSLIQEMGGTAECSLAAVEYTTVQELEAGLTREIGSTHWDMIYFTLGEQSRADASGQASMKRVLEILQQSHAQLMWGSSPPRPVDTGNPGHQDQISRLNACMNELLRDRDVYINDCHDYVTRNLQDYLSGTEAGMSPADQQSLAVAIAEAIKFFGN